VSGTYQSILIPYQNEIIALRRRKLPTPYSQIAKLLSEKYQITVSRQNIFSFLKVRAKGFNNKKCKYAWDVEFESTSEQLISEAPALQEPPFLQTPVITQTPVSDTPKPTVKDKPKSFIYDESEPLPEFEFPFTDISEIGVLQPLPPEEAAAFRKRYGLE